MVCSIFAIYKYKNIPYSPHALLSITQGETNFIKKVFMYNSSFLFFGTMILLDVVYCIIKLEKTRFIVPYKESKVLQLAPTTKDFLITARKNLCTMIRFLTLDCFLITIRITCWIFPNLAAIALLHNICLSNDEKSVKNF